MSLMIRVDDFPGTKPAENFKHNLENFKRFHHYLTSYDDFRYTLGVIPGYTKPVDLKWLKEQDIDIALHGVVHSESHLDEFYGKQYQAIETALLHAKNFLELYSECRTISYIPPHNTISADTVLALSRLGFDRIYGGPETEEDMKGFIKLEGMEYIHSEPPLEYGRSDELMERGAVNYLREECKTRDIWLTLHAPWEINIGLENLRNFMMKLHDADVF